MLCLLDNTPIVRHFGRIVGNADLVVEQLAPGVAHETHQLGAAQEQLTGPVQLLDPGRQCPQQCSEPLGSLLTVHLVMLCHGHLEDQHPLGRVQVISGR